MATSTELRKQASQHYKDAEDSFQRSDTDGFLSQWASGIAGQKASRQADIEENGGVWPFRCLMDGERRVNAKVIDGTYGQVWLLADSEEARYGRRFIPIGARSRIQRELGLQEGTEDAPAKAKTWGKGTGLAGAASVQVIVVRTDLYDWSTDDLGGK